MVFSIMILNTSISFFLILLILTGILIFSMIKLKKSDSYRKQLMEEINKEFNLPPGSFPSVSYLYYLMYKRKINNDS